VKKEKDAEKKSSQHSPSSLETTSRTSDIWKRVFTGTGSLLGTVLVLDPIWFSGWKIHDLDTTYDEGGQQNIVLTKFISWSPEILN
jgi:hypothetical protein